MDNKHIFTLRFKNFDDEWNKSTELNSVIKKQFKGKVKQDKLNSGFVLEEQYLNASNWKDGEAHKFNFGTSEQFTTIEYSVEYVEYGDE